MNGRVKFPGACPLKFSAIGESPETKGTVNIHKYDEAGKSCGALSSSRTSS